MAAIRAEPVPGVARAARAAGSVGDAVWAATRALSRRSTSPGTAAGAGVAAGLPLGCGTAALCTRRRPVPSGTSAATAVPAGLKLGRSATAGPVAWTVPSGRVTTRSWPPPSVEWRR